MKLETLYYQLVKKSDPPHGVLGHGKNALYYLFFSLYKYISTVFAVKVYQKLSWRIIAPAFITIEHDLARVEHSLTELSFYSQTAYMCCKMDMNLHFKELTLKDVYLYSHTGAWLPD